MPFVSLEGIDGSGKTTQAKSLASTLRAAGHEVVLTQEPSGGHLGPEVRSILIHRRPVALTSTEEMLLVSVARYDHVRSVIRPALGAGKWVICDRFVDSTYAFQVFETDLELATFEAVTTAVVGKTMPDLTFILDLSIDRALERRAARSASAMPDPDEKTRNFERIRRGLLDVAAKDSRRYHVLDADRPEAEISSEIHSILGRNYPIISNCCVSL